MDKVAKATVGSKCEHCGMDVYVISAGLWVHTLNGISRCPDKSAPSKERQISVASAKHLSDELETWLAVNLERIKSERYADGFDAGASAIEKEKP